jgi:hypothetical protein
MKTRLLWSSILSLTLVQIAGWNLLLVFPWGSHIFDLVLISLPLDQGIEIT